MPRFLAPLLVILASVAHAETTCKVDDAYADFVQRAKSTQGAGDEARLAALHDFLAAHAGLYTAEAIGIVPGPELERAGLHEMAAVNATAAEFDAALQHGLATSADRFAQTLPDFRCDFVLYVAPTFGQMDGAGRVVNGKPALVFGPDVIAGYQTPGQLPVFIAHELFHRYHFAAAGFSDDLAERELLWRTLWAEGLATYASARLNPDRPLADAMLLPRDLAERAAPLVPTLAREISVKLDVVDAATFARFFEGGDASARARGWPARSGYYLGYLVAESLAQRYTLPELAHLQGPALRREIGAVLTSLAAGR
jgi:hypothetical protein